jgi:hypothetical protein
MATEKELYERALKKFGDPDKAASFVADYLSKQGGSKSASEKKEAAPAPVVDHARKPMGGPKNGATARSTVAVKPAAPKPEVKPVYPAAWMPSVGEARMADRADLASAEAYGRWAAGPGQERPAGALSGITIRSPMERKVDERANRTAAAPTANRYEEPAITYRAATDAKAPPAAPMDYMPTPARTYGPEAPPSPAPMTMTEPGKAPVNVDELSAAKAYYKSKGVPDEAFKGMSDNAIIVSAQQAKMAEAR